MEQECPRPPSISRRTFLGGALCASWVAPVAAEPRQEEAPRRVAGLGVLPGSNPHWKLFRDRLRALGRREGREVLFAWRGGDLGQLPDLAREVVELGVDLLVTGATSASLAARDATRRIPIVFVAVGDPLGTGLVDSLARPAGNVTGVSTVGPALIGKQLEVLREVTPGGTRVTVLWNPANATHGRLLLGEAEPAARTLGLTLRLVGARGPDELAPLIESTRATADALLILDDLLFLLHRERLAQLTAATGLPVVHGAVAHAEVGGLMALAPAVEDQWERAAMLADRVLRGAAPGDLPVEQPTRFTLVINLRTARTLGLRVRPSLLWRANRLIE